MLRHAHNQPNLGFYRFLNGLSALRRGYEDGGGIGFQLLLCFSQVR